MRVDRIRLIAEMAKKDCTVKMLASLTGISRATISSVKNGKTCSYDTANRIAKALGLEIDELVESTDMSGVFRTSG